MRPFTSRVGSKSCDVLVWTCTLIVMTTSTTSSTATATKTSTRSTTAPITETTTNHVTSTLLHRPAYDDSSNSTMITDNNSTTDQSNSPFMTTTPIQTADKTNSQIKTVATSSAMSLPDASTSTQKKGSLVTTTGPNKSTIPVNDCTSQKALESTFGTHGVLAFSLTLAVTLLLLYALCMLKVMPVVLSRRRAKAADNNEVETHGFRRRNSDLEAEMGPLNLANSKELVNNKETSPEAKDQGDNSKGPEGSGAHQRTSDGVADTGVAAGAVSTFLLRHPSLTTQDLPMNKSPTSGDKSETTATHNENGGYSSRSKVADERVELLPTHLNESENKNNSSAAGPSIVSQNTDSGQEQQKSLLNNTPIISGADSFPVDNGPGMKPSNKNEPSFLDNVADVEI